MRKQYIDDREKRLTHMTSLYKDLQTKLEQTETALLQSNKFRVEIKDHVQSLEATIGRQALSLEIAKKYLDQFCSGEYRDNNVDGISNQALSEISEILKGKATDDQN